MYIELVSLLRDVFYFLSYVSGRASFPNPLSQEEEREYIKRMKDGDKEARNTLIERNQRLVAHLAKKFYNSGLDPDDLISIGTIGLIKAVDNFHPSNGAQLATFASRCIENAILTQR